MSHQKGYGIQPDQPTTRENKQKNVHIWDLFKPIQLDDQRIASGVEVPDSIYQELLTKVMEREHLAYSGAQTFQVPAKNPNKVLWLRMERLPLHPDNEETYDLLYRWQSALSTMHAWGYRIYFLLLRYEGETRLYIGTETSVDDPSASGLSGSKRLITAEDALSQLKQALQASLPGVGLRELSSAHSITDEINIPLRSMERVGAVTGIPSFRKDEDNSRYQTLDQLAFGLRDAQGGERNYALLVIADPISDGETAGIISNYRKLGSKIHSAVNASVTENDSSSETKKSAATAVAGILGGLLDSLLATCSLGMLKTGFASTFAHLTLDKTVTLTSSTGVTRQYLDRFAQYAETMTVKHEQRLEEGRNLGFWNAGTYVLAEEEEDVVTVTGLLRSIYSGQETYLEPIRTHSFHPDSNARKILNQNNLIPCYDGPRMEISGFSSDREHWHILGDCYQYISTPVNTRELGLITSLPRRDVPGLRFTKTAVRFANNPASIAEESTFALGKIMDMGVEQTSEYRIGIHSLVRHALIAGSTGSGKSTTSKRILENAIRENIPVMVIEPAKDDFVSWALEMNKHISDPEQQFRIYMPSLRAPDEQLIHPFYELRLNPFQPACVEGQMVDMLSHSDTLTGILNASLPASDVLPTIIDETVYRFMQQFFGMVFQEVLQEEQGDYPLMSNMLKVGLEILESRSYAQEVRDNLRGYLETRFNYLTRGMRGQVLNVGRSTPFAELFDRNVIINVSQIGNTRDRALIMSLLMLNLIEYRKSQFHTDPEYRRKAEKENRLMRLTLVEEAHNLLRKPSGQAEGTGDPQRVVAEFFADMLSEIRGYGQGIMIADQVPTRLIEDAVKNTNYKITHRLVSPDDCEVMANSMSLREDQRRILATLGVGNAIVYGDQDDAAAWVRVYRSSQKD